MKEIAAFGRDSVLFYNSAALKAAEDSEGRFISKTESDL